MLIVFGLGLQNITHGVRLEDHHSLFKHRRGCCTVQHNVCPDLSDQDLQRSTLFSLYSAHSKYILIPSDTGPKHRVLFLEKQQAVILRYCEICSLTWLCFFH